MCLYIDKTDIQTYYSPSNNSWTFCKCLSSTWVYICVVVIDAWPRSVCTALMSAPFLISAVAKLCLSVCGETFLLIHTSAAYFLTISSMLFLLRCWPKPFLDTLINKYGLVSFLNFVYIFNALMACLVANTERSFDHFPTTENWLESN